MMTTPRTLLLAGFGDENAKKELELRGEREKNERDGDERMNVKPTSKSPREILAEAYSKQDK